MTNFGLFKGKKYTGTQSTLAKNSWLSIQNANSR